MHRERVSDDIHIFISGLYAQVTAGVIRTSDGVVVVDSLPFPQESRQLLAFAERLHPKGVRYLILTHFHADHVNGAYLFPDARVIGHVRCHELLLRQGVEQLARAKQQTPELVEVNLRPPNVLFEDDLTLRIGGKTIDLVYSPGHSLDGIRVHVQEDKSLFASDTVTPIPFIVDGSVSSLIASLESMKLLTLENVVQGHGSVLLRGEIKETLDRNIHYLETLQKWVCDGLAQDKSPEEIASVDVEFFGLSRIPMGGLTQQFHQANILYLCRVVAAEKSAAAS